MLSLPEPCFWQKQDWEEPSPWRHSKPGLEGVVALAFGLSPKGDCCLETLPVPSLASQDQKAMSDAPSPSWFFIEA